MEQLVGAEVPVITFQALVLHSSSSMVPPTGCPLTIRCRR